MRWDFIELLHIYLYVSIIAYPAFEMVYRFTCPVFIMRREKNCERGFSQKSLENFIEEEMEGRKVNWKKKKKKRNKGNIFGEKTHRYKCSWNFREVWRWRECGPSSFPFEVYAANVSWQFHSLQTLIRHRECEARSYFCKKKLGFSFNPFQLFQFQF